MTINGRPIDAASPVFVIAEIGVNHDGSVDRALELVRIAQQCGADAVKLQIFQAAALMHDSSRFADYQKTTSIDADPQAMLRRYELTDAELRRVVAAIKDAGLTPIATPFSLSDVDAVQQLDLPAIKIASPDLVNYPLLQRCAGLRRPMIVSTGAADLDEIAACCDWLRGWGVEFALLHCTSSYPTPAELTNLCWIAELQRFGVAVGFSDHCTETISGALATAAGACIVERHLTYDRAAAGPDHAASSDPRQFAEYVRLIRQAQILRGTPGKRVLPIEQDVRTVSRQSLVCRRDLKAGQIISADDLTVQRPGTGISAADWAKVIGRNAAQSIPAGTMLTWEMVQKSAYACAYSVRRERVG